MAEPVAPVVAAPPPEQPARDVQVVVHLVVDAEGRVESAIAAAQTPGDAPQAFAEAAVEAVRNARFTPSRRDGQAFRSRVEYVVVFDQRKARVSAPVSAPGAVPRALPLGAQTPEVVVRGSDWPRARGAGELLIRRELLDASPRSQTSEMLSAAPGFFVDHEDGEGLGNDVYLRGFDLEHGSGIEMRVGSIPTNVPNHVQGQGYADVNFIIPEVVRGIRIREGSYDPRQGDAAIVGSADFDLGVQERGASVRASYGSFQQRRLVGVLAPANADEQTFAAFAVRSTDGFGQRRRSLSASVNAQYAVPLGTHDRLRILATGYGSRAQLPGVVRADDVSAGRLGFYDAYPYFAQGQGVQAGRLLLGASLAHAPPGEVSFELGAWFMRTDFRARQNFAGALESSQLNPNVSGLGDLFETENRESAVGVDASVRSATFTVGPLALQAESGVVLRSGQTDQAKSLLNPDNLQPWDRRLRQQLTTLDVGCFGDVSLLAWQRLRVSGGPRADLLWLTTDDELRNVVPAGSAPPGALPGAARAAAALLVGLRGTAEYRLTSAIFPSLSFGQGFRSLSAERIAEGSPRPYSKVRSVEGGVRISLDEERYVARLAGFETRVGNELVFEAVAGGLETQNESVRRGLVASILAKPKPWLLTSSALSVTRAVFTTRVPGISHYVPNVPALLLRVDATARGSVTGRLPRALNGRVGVGYTLMSGRRVTDTRFIPANHVVNASAGLRYGAVELALDVFNALGERYADDQQFYASNWSFVPGQQRASLAVHDTAAPPRTLLGTLSLYF